MTSPINPYLKILHPHMGLPPCLGPRLSESGAVRPMYNFSSRSGKCSGAVSMLLLLFRKYCATEKVIEREYSDLFVLERRQNFDKQKVSGIL